jgi:hypothetical protein
MDQQNIQEKITVKRKFDLIKDKCFCNDGEAQTGIKQET